MVYILLGEGFEEAEALVTADVLRRAEVPVSLTGIGGDFVAGSHGITVKADVTVESVSLSGGDMVVLPGGLGGVASMEGSGPAMALIRQAAENPEIWLAAICAAPTLLARAGLLPQGVPCVCYPGMEDGLTGASVPAGERVVVDGTVITGQAAGSSLDFGLTLIETLLGRDKAEEVRQGVCYR